MRPPSRPFIPADTPKPDPNPTMKDVRRRLMLSVADLAQRSGVSIGTVTKIEAGEVAHPQWRTVVAMLDALGIVRGGPLPEPLPERPRWEPLRVDTALD